MINELFVSKEQYELLSDKLDIILSMHRSLPSWYPITREFAIECGYKTIDGLRKWCYNNLNPDDFVKRGKHWFIGIKSLPYCKNKNCLVYNASVSGRRIKE